MKTPTNTTTTMPPLRDETIEALQDLISINIDSCEGLRTASDTIDDASIAGTQLQQVEVGLGEVVVLPESFKITAALAIVTPGADAPEPVDAAPVLSWIDDASEDRYEVVVHDARGEEIWRDAEIPAASGVEAVELPYGGPALTSGMYYQFRVTSWRDTPQGSTALSRSEDLLGVFVVR